MAFVGDPGLFRPEADEVHVSCTFTWDKPEAERLAHAWGQYYPIVKLGGPAYGDRGGKFLPGQYLKYGYVITSRGCPNRCEFCPVPKREGRIRTLPIFDGWYVQDNNLLACPRDHIEAVMEMLTRQLEPIRLTGGIEAARVEPWWAELAAALRLRVLYLAYDRPSDARALATERAVGMLKDAGLSQRQVGCYVLVGFSGDTLQEAAGRLRWVFDIGAVPYAMYYRGPKDARPKIPRKWAGLVREWCRPAAIFAHKGRT